MMKNRLIPLFIACVMLAGLFATTSFAVTDDETAFSDVPATHWAHAAITWMPIRHSQWCW